MKRNTFPFYISTRIILFSLAVYYDYNENQIIVRLAAVHQAKIINLSNPIMQLIISSITTTTTMGRNKRMKKAAPLTDDENEMAELILITMVEGLFEFLTPALKRFLVRKGLKRHLEKLKHRDDPQQFLKIILEQMKRDPDFLPEMTPSAVGRALDARNQCAHIDLPLIHRRWLSSFDVWIQLANAVGAPAEAENLRVYRDALV